MAGVGGAIVPSRLTHHPQEVPAPPCRSPLPSRSMQYIERMRSKESPAWFQSAGLFCDR